MKYMMARVPLREQSYEPHPKLLSNKPLRKICYLLPEDGRVASIPTEGKQYMCSSINSKDKREGKCYIESPKLLRGSLPSSGLTSCDLCSSHPTKKIVKKSSKKQYLLVTALTDK